MTSLLLDQFVPGATTCLVIGAFDFIAPFERNHYQAVLWLVVDENAAPRWPGPHPERTQIVRLKSSGGSDVPVLLEQFVRKNPRELPSLYITDRVGGIEGVIYEQSISQVYALFEETRRARLTRQRDGFIWQKHVLLNARHYIERRLPDEWAGKLAGLPAVICGAGPSLDVTARLLPALEGKAVFFSADSALRALAAHAIRADFAISIDAAKLPSKCLPEHLPPDRIILASVSPSDWWSEATRERIHFLSSNQLTEDWLASKGIPRTNLSASESCGSTAIELALHLGCGPLYLFGLDLAVDSSNQARRHHTAADRSLYTQSNYNPTAQLPSVPGNYAKTVPCFALGDWRALNSRLGARPPQATPIYNVNDRGARLDGTTLLHPDAFSFVAPGKSKIAPLASLLPRPKSDDPAADAAIGMIRQMGASWLTAIPELKHQLSMGGPAGLAEGLRSLMLAPEAGRVLGGFAMKVLPHLFPPLTENAAFWEGLLLELEELAGYAWAL